MATHPHLPEDLNIMFVLFCLVFVQSDLYHTSVSGASQVRVKNFISVMESVMRPYIGAAMRVHTHNRKRVAVLISGTGSNLQVCFRAV
jgi:hypothetical protein